jgi:hypothetical protein
VPREGKARVGRRPGQTVSREESLIVLFIGTQPKTFLHHQMPWSSTHALVLEDGGRATEACDVTPRAPPSAQP